MSAWEAPGASNEWYTPAHVFEALGCRFDLDVAAPVNGPLHVPTSRWISSGSLEAVWHPKDFVWMNSPFEGKNGLRPWLEKFAKHGNGIALTPDRTSAPWFFEMWDRAELVLFVREKIKFIRPDGSLGKQPGTGTALWAIGPQAVAALRRAASLGYGVLATPTPRGRSIGRIDDGSPA